MLSRISFSISPSKCCIPSVVPSRIASRRVLPSASPLAHQNDLGGLAQRRSKGERKARGIAVQLALMNGAILVRVEELDRVFDGDDVVGVLLIDLINDGSQGRRLARTGGAGDQHNASAQIHH